MELLQPTITEEMARDDKIESGYQKLTALITALAKRDGPDEVVEEINAEIERVSAGADTAAELKRLIRRAYSSIINQAEKGLKLVPRNHYRTLWTGLGIAVFGVPLGVAMGTALGNMAFMGAGIPIGLAIGVGVGTSMDSKAAAEGRQLDIDE